MLRQIKIKIVKHEIKGRNTMEIIKKALNAKALVSVALLFVASLAQASVASTDPFYEFFTDMDSWINGGLGVGLAFAFLIFGGVVGVAKNNPIPALAGVVAAAFFKFAPGLIVDMLAAGAVVESIVSATQSLPIL